MSIAGTQRTKRCRVGRAYRSGRLICGWVQVTVDSDRAGSGLLNLAVDDLAATREELATRGVDTAEI